MMELYIETLTGAAFELRVSPFETIMSVKAKIQRLEGIPISQQHLIWQSMELEDDYCLHDYSIHDGATLKLVLAMRGGPINTRRVAMEDPALREMAEYMEANREEILDKLPGNRQVTLLVYREGDQLNFFRVVDRGDGTLTPLSESLSPLHFSGTPMYNLYDEEEDEEVETKEIIEENMKTKEKMELLRSQMENLTIAKKPKKKVMPRPPSSGRPGSRTRSSAHRLNSSAGYVSRQQIGALAKDPLPPVGQGLNQSASVNQNPPEPPSGRSSANSALSMGNNSTTTAADTPNEVITPIPNRRIGLEVLDSAKLKRPLSSVKEDSIAMNASRKLASSMVGPAQNSKNLETRDSLETECKEQNALSNKLKASSPVPEAQQTDAAIPKSLDIPHLKTKLSHALSYSAQNKDFPGDLSPASESQTVELPASWLNTSHASYSSRNRESVGHPISLRPPMSSNKGLERILDHNGYEAAMARPITSASSRRGKDLALENLVRPPTSKYNIERKQGLMLESLSQSEARGLLRQASIERLGSSKLANFVRSASKSRAGHPLGSANPKDGSRVSTPEGRLVSGRLQHRVSASRDRVSPGSRLPPVKQKKKASKRCLVCTKKTGLATSYQCRCGNNFCATHRYAEAHDCTFDYKTEGRKLLEQANPVVNAPKLPKI